MHRETDLEMHRETDQEMHREMNREMNLEMEAPVTALATTDQSYGPPSQTLTAQTPPQLPGSGIVHYHCSDAVVR